MKMKLEKGTATFKMTISPKAESKIRLLCKYYPDKEWSGVLFYETQGSFDKDLKIIVLDILQMGEGNSCYTEYRYSPDIIAYMTDNDLLSSYIGHIHSHHAMKAFFSETDLDTLYDAGKDTNCFVSLVVNNSGNYVAAITRKVKVISEINECLECKEWDSVSNASNVRTEENEIIQYFNLNVRVYDQYEEEIRERIKELSTPAIIHNRALGMIRNLSLFPDLSEKDKHKELFKLKCCDRIMSDFINMIMEMEGEIPGSVTEALGSMKYGKKWISIIKDYTK